MNKLAFGEQIDHKRATELNQKYYVNTVELPFETYAMDWYYQKAVGKLIYSFIEKRQDTNYTILELGAHGVYFERGVYKAIAELDREKGTHFADKIQYRVLDISEKNIEIAERIYEQNRGIYFSTEFYIGNVLNESILPKNNNIIIMNELLDDLPTLVIERSIWGLYEIVFDIECLANKTWLYPNKKSRINAIDEKEKKWILDHLGIGHAMTFSPVMHTLFNNITKSLVSESITIVHDYFSLDAEDSRLLKRAYGSIDCENKKADGSIQITADVNFEQLIETMQNFGYEIEVVVPTEDFINGEFKRVDDDEIKRELKRVKEETSKSLYLNVVGVLRR